MKDTCIPLLDFHYQDALQLNVTYENQLQLQDAIQDSIEDLLERSKFHLGPDDEESDVSFLIHFPPSSSYLLLPGRQCDAPLHQGSLY